MNKQLGDLQGMRAGGRVERGDNDREFRVVGVVMDQWCGECGGVVEELECKGRKVWRECGDCGRRY